MERHSTFAYVCKSHNERSLYTQNEKKQKQTTLYLYCFKQAYQTYTQQAQIDRQIELILSYSIQLIDILQIYEERIIALYRNELIQQRSKQR